MKDHSQLSASEASRLITTRLTGVVVLQPIDGHVHDDKCAAMREAHVWLWVVEQEKVSAITELYENINFKYNIFHNTYVGVHAHGLTARLILPNCTTNLEMNLQMKREQRYRYTIFPKIFTPFGLDIHKKRTIFMK